MSGYGWVITVSTARQRVDALIAGREQTATREQYSLLNTLSQQAFGERWL